MTDTTSLTCAALYEYDLTFRAGIATWVAERRCPIALGDFLREQGLDAAADCADWAATEPDRGIRKPFDGMSGPYPDPDADGNWYFIAMNDMSFSYDIPGNQTADMPHCDEVHEAILHLLDHWIART